MPDLKLLHDAILNGDAKAAKSLTEAALAANVPPLQLVQEYMVPAMGEVGRRFECSEYFVPELLLAARAM
jgi:5-methyltetrahydrofolate--homocysteine methyltransferase